MSPRSIALVPRYLCHYGVMRLHAVRTKRAQKRMLHEHTHPFVLTLASFKSSLTANNFAAAFLCF